MISQYQIIQRNVKCAVGGGKIYVIFIKGFIKVWCGYVCCGGIQGIQGEKWEKGDTGPQGEKGDTGPQGEKGDKGDTGEQDIQGEKGEKGDTGETPEITVVEDTPLN